MSVFLQMSHLPTRPVTLVVAGTGVLPYTKSLKSMGIKVLQTDKLSALQPPLCFHADLAVLPLNGNRFLLECTQTKLANALRTLGAQVQFCSRAEPKYPLDAGLNCVRIGSYLLCNPKSVHADVLTHAKLENLRVIPCKQGYTKCSVAIVNETALITDDPGIAKATCGIFDTLLVQKGSVQLQGYPYGFIGGCCALLSHDTMGFLGDVSTHANADSICAFLKNHGKTAISLGAHALVDIGSIFPVLEKE